METLTRRVRLHRRQAEFHHHPALFRAFCGGRGSGKSWVGAYDLLRRGRRGRTYLVASPTATLMADTTYPAFKALAEDLGVWGEVKLTPYPTATLTTGAVVRFRTAEDPEKLRGPNLSGAWLDEASLMEEESYTIVIASLREQGEQGWLSATFTPKGPLHWTHAVFNTSRPNTRLFRARTRDNPFNPAGFEDRLREQYDSLFALQELAGEFVQIEGAEWPASYFGRDLWFPEWPAEEDRACTVVAWDPSKGSDAAHGDYSAFTVLVRDVQGGLWVDALGSRRWPVEEACDTALELCRVWAPDGFALETNQFQSLIWPILRDRARALGVAPPPIYKIDNRKNKEVRIRRLGPYLERKTLRLKGGSAGSRLLAEQLMTFPKGDHDDFPDSLEMGLRTMIKLCNARN